MDKDLWQLDFSLNETAQKKWMRELTNYVQIMPHKEAVSQNKQ